MQGLEVKLPLPPPLPLFLLSCASPRGLQAQLCKKRGRGGGSVSEWAQNSAGAPLWHHIFFFLKWCCTLSYYFLQFHIHMCLLQLPSPHSMHLRPWCNTHGFCKFSVEIQSGLEAVSLNSVFPCVFCTFACLWQLQNKYKNIENIWKTSTQKVRFATFSTGGILGIFF